MYPMKATSIHGTPIAKKLVSTDRFSTSTMHRVRDYRMRHLGEEIQEKCIGPMPVEDFLVAFLGPEPCAVEAKIGFTEERKEAFKPCAGHFTWE